MGKRACTDIWALARYIRRPSGYQVLMSPFPCRLLNPGKEVVKASSCDLQHNAKNATTTIPLPDRIASYDSRASLPVIEPCNFLPAKPIEGNTLARHLSMKAYNAHMFGAQ